MDKGVNIGREGASVIVSMQVLVSAFLVYLLSFEISFRLSAGDANVRANKLLYPTIELNPEVPSNNFVFPASFQPIAYPHTTTATTSMSMGATPTTGNVAPHEPIVLERTAPCLLPPIEYISKVCWRRLVNYPFT